MKTRARVRWGAGVEPLRVVLVTAVGVHCGDGGEFANGSRHRTETELGVRGVGKQAGNDIRMRAESRVQWRQQRVRERPESSGASRSDGGQSGSSAGPVLGTTRGRGEGCLRRGGSQ